MIKLLLAYGADIEGLSEPSSPGAGLSNIHIQ